MYPGHQVTGQQAPFAPIECRLIGRRPMQGDAQFRAIDLAETLSPKAGDNTG